MFGMPFHWTGIDGWIHSPAPTLGQHNREVLSGILGLEARDLDDLEERQVIGTRPLGV
jgi:crotonobetainyl-CoA:carnitine CoA-transferase CaiB-like acyl-CoA transferase